MLKNEAQGMLPACFKELWTRLMRDLTVVYFVLKTTLYKRRRVKAITAVDAVRLTR